MKDSNKPLRKAIYEALQPALGDVPVYYKYIPNQVSVDAYVLISSINNNDASTMSSHDTENSVQVSIYTKDGTANSGVQCDELANTIFTTLLPTPQASLNLPGFQCCGLKLINDISPDALDNGSSIFINRFITFRITLFHEPLV